MYTTVGTYYSFLDDCLLSGWIGIQPAQQTSNNNNNNKYHLYTYGCTS